MVLIGPRQVNSLAKTTVTLFRVANLSPGMVTGVAEHVQRRTGAYWRDLAFGRLAPALFFSLFLARQLILLWGGIQGLRQPGDLLFVGELLRLRWEESILAQTFPNEYSDYARRVPRYLPNPFSRH